MSRGQTGLTNDTVAHVTRYQTELEIQVNSRRLAVGGLAVLASATFALAGCAGSSSGAGGDSASATPSPAPKEALQAAVKQLSQTTYTYTAIGPGLNGHGAVDPVGKKFSLSLMSMDFVLIGSHLYAKMDWGAENSISGIPTKWMHLDPAKLGKDAPPHLDPSAIDPTQTSALFGGLVDAQRVDATHYNATFDLTNAGDSSLNAESPTLKKLGDIAKAAPGTVTLDEQGRLTSLTIDLSSVDSDLSIKNTFSDYGSPVSLSPPPPADTVEAPTSVYEVLGGMS